MKTKNSLFKLLRNFCLLCVFALGFITIVATGGGGGDGGGGNGGDGNGGNGTTDLSYTGLTTQAVINQDNAQDLAIGAYNGGKVGSTPAAVGAIRAESGLSNDRMRLYNISKVLEDSIRQVDPVSKYDGSLFVGAIQQDTGTIYGGCGGSASYTIEVDEQTGEFDGSISFNSYCDSGVTLTGDMDYSGEIDLQIDALLTFDISLENVSGNIDGDSITISGDISMDMSVLPIVLTIDMLIKDNSSGDVFWVENYEMIMTEGEGYVDIDVSGRFYEPNNGWVEIGTTTPLRFFTDSDYPAQGVLVALGDNDTVARLTVLPDTTFQIEADTDGDGTFDYNSGVLNWSEI